MPRIERTAHVDWEGSVARGSGTITAGSGAFEGLAHSLPTRVGGHEGNTSPEELLAAAHGGCITMSLASELVSAGTPPGRLDVDVRIVMDEVEGQGHQILASYVDARVAVDGLDDAALQTALDKAHKSCPFSQLLERAGAEVHVSASLA
jgi:lipoyl-dependent peroxiredoxin